MTKQIIETMKFWARKLRLQSSISITDMGAAACVFDAAIAELEKQEAVQVEPVAYPNGEMCHKWFTECEGGGRYSITARFDYVGRKIIDWYRSQHPAPKPADDKTNPYYLAIDDACVTAHIGTAESFATPKEALNAIIAWEISVATDPAVNGGFSFRPPAPDVLAVLDELESVENLLREAHQLGFRTAANWAQRDDMHSDVHSGAYCNDQAGDLHDIFTKVRTLTAKLRSMLGVASNAEIYAQPRP